MLITIPLRVRPPALVSHLAGGDREPAMALLRACIKDVEADISAKQLRRAALVEQLMALQAVGWAARKPRTLRYTVRRTNRKEQSR